MFERKAAGRGDEADGAALHISSLVVQAQLSNTQTVNEAISRLCGTEIHAVTAGGRMIVSLETQSEAAIHACVGEIGRLAGVLSVALVFHHAESWQTRTE